MNDMLKITCKALKMIMPFIVLHDGDTMLFPEAGGIDIMVPSGRAVQACNLLATAARQEGWFLLNFRNISYVASIVLVKPVESGDDIAIKVDFISGLEWYGIGSGVVSAWFFAQALPEAVMEGKLSALAGAVSLLRKSMANGHLSLQDWTRIGAGDADSDFLLKTAGVLHLPLRPDDVVELGLSDLKKWRMRAASSGVNRLADWPMWLCQAIYAHLRYKLAIGFSSGHIFGLSGLDGSGKSTQIDRLLAAYKKSGMTMPKLVHLLPSWIPMPHQLISRRKTTSNYARPYAEAPVTSHWNGVLRLAYYLIAFAVAKTGMQFAAYRDTVFVMDRSFADLAADMTRARIPAYPLPDWLLRFCAPKGCLIYLDTDAITVVQRKNELTLEKATGLREHYLDVFTRIRGQIISGEGSPTEVFTHILELMDVIYFERLSGVASRGK